MFYTILATIGLFVTSQLQLPLPLELELLTQPYIRELLEMDLFLHPLHF